MKQNNNIELIKSIANSLVDDDNFNEWIHSTNINCYGFARGLTYPDLKQQFYAPGKLFNIKFGFGEFARTEYTPPIIDKYIMRDSFALEQNVERISFDNINENDGNFYFALTDFSIIPLGKNDHHWHFICRTQSGIWLHKPNWYQPVQKVNWSQYGKTFHFDTITQQVGSRNNPESNPIFLPCEGKCFKDYFYKIDFPD